MKKFKKFIKGEGKWYSTLMRDFIISLLLIIILLSALYLYTGVWPPMVVVEGDSMHPNIQHGDVVMIKDSEITTYEEGVLSDSTSFGEPGDVIVYNIPHDGGKAVIHRAMYWVEEGEEMWEDGPEAPHAGYITQGDNEQAKDQQSELIAKNEPIKEEWIEGKAFLRIPYVGWIRLGMDHASNQINDVINEMNSVKIPPNLAR